MEYELFDAAIKFAVARRASKGDAQAGRAEIERSVIKDGFIILRYKPLSGWRFPEVELTRVSLSDIA